MGARVLVTCKTRWDQTTTTRADRADAPFSHERVQLTLERDGLDRDRAHSPNMVRRFNSAVHKQVSRLMRGGFPMKEPAWYQAVLDHPPLPLPARAPPKRTAFDSHWNSFHENPHQRRPLPIYYLEDRVRKQFFADHPFETVRPRTLVEDEKVSEEHLVQGEAWTRLREGGRNASPDE